MEVKQWVYPTMSKAPKHLPDCTLALWQDWLKNILTIKILYFWTRQEKIDCSFKTV